MKMILTILVIVIVSAGIFYGCNDEKREKMLNTISNTVRQEKKEPSTPDIVAEQKQREIIRQNRTWTPENQAKYPVEYCQAQLEKLNEHATALEVSIHKINIVTSECRRKITECEERLKTLDAFLNMAKAKYRDAESKKAFPVEFNGYMLTQQQAQKKIIQASRQIPELKKHLFTRKNQIVQLDKKRAALTAEQVRVAALRERVQNTINDLQTKKVIDGNRNIMDVLNSLNDSIDSLGGNINDPSLNDVITPVSDSAEKAEFDSIMGVTK